VYTSYERNAVSCTRQKVWLNIAVIVVVGIMAWGAASGQSGIGQFDPLVRTSARRLAIAEQVALSKWDSGAAVEDATREAQVIQGAVTAGEARGIDAASVTKFFRAQIEANKVVQYSLLAEWRRQGGAPSHAPINLAGVVRPELDQLQAELVAELADTKEIRSGARCRIEVAIAVGKYIAVHRKEASTLTEIGLDRALSESCADSLSQPLSSSR
jgi:chorismate mutase